MRKINRGTLRTKGAHLVTYADDYNEEKKQDQRNNKREERKMSLSVYKDKTKIIRYGKGKKKKHAKVKIGWG